MGAEAASGSGPFALLTPRSSDGAGDIAARPLVVLLGWAAADRDKAVLKYAELLAQRGYASVRSVQPLLTAFSPLALTRRRWALSLLSYLEQQRLWLQRRLVLFAFSNGGLYVVEQLMLIAESDPRYSRLPSTVAALVVDSAPVTAGPGAVENVIAASAPPGWRRWVMTRYIKGSMRLRGPDGGMAAYWESLRRMGWGRPQLFMYSRDDPIANAAKIDQLVAEKQALGQDVRARCWEQSAHCAHLKHHTEEYTRLLFGLLDEVQNRQSGSNGDGGRGSSSTEGSSGSGGGSSIGSGGGSSGGSGGGADKQVAVGAPRARL